MLKIGDKVTAGQIIAEVSNFDKGFPPGFGAVEIGILKGGQTPEHVYPWRSEFIPGNRNSRLFNFRSNKGLEYLPFTLN